MAHNDTIKEDSRKIANFIFMRLFPAMDDFSAAHRLTIPMEAALLSFLARRLLTRGLSRGFIVQVVQDATKDQEEQTFPQDNVIPLRPRT